MEAEYIMAIVVGSLFLVLFVVFIIFYVKNKKEEELQRQRLEQMYADKNLVKMEYDYSDYDEETERILAARTERRKQISFNDIYPSAIPSAENSASTTVDADGLEEITGNYKPE